MKILFIDFGSFTHTLALVSEGKLPAMATIEPKAEADIIPALDALLKKAKWKLEDLTHIAVVIGPGGFMSLRTGVALANALSATLKIPSAGMHLSDVWAARAVGSNEWVVDRKKKATHYPPVRTAWPGGLPTTHSLIWLHSTRSTQLFVRGFGKLAKKWPEPTVIDIEQLHVFFDAAAISGSTVLTTGRSLLRKNGGMEYLGELIPAHQEKFPNLTPAKVRLLTDILPEFLVNQTYASNQTLLPWYGREG